jgi:hypothetical protein
MENDLYDDPEARAAIILSLGNAWSNHGLNSRTEPMLSDALDTLVESEGEPTRVGVVRGPLARTLCETARSYFSGGELEKAGAACRVVLSMANRADPDGAEALVILAKIALDMEDEPLARDHANAAVEWLENTAPFFRKEAADLIMELASAFRVRGFAETADAFSLRELEFREAR